MVGKITKILNQFGYKIGYSPYHKKEEIEKSLKKEKNICLDDFFTLYSREGLVILRIHTCRKDSDFNKKNLEQIIHVFKIFELPHRKEILAQLKNLN